MLHKCSRTMFGLNAAFFLGDCFLLAHPIVSHNYFNILLPCEQYNRMCCKCVVTTKGVIYELAIFLLK